MCVGVVVGAGMVVGGGAGVSSLATRPLATSSTGIIVYTYTL